MDSTTLEQAAQAAYEAHHAEMFDIAWNDMPDWKKHRWRLAAQAVIAVATTSASSSIAA